MSRAPLSQANEKKTLGALNTVGVGASMPRMIARRRQRMDTYTVGADPRPPHPRPRPLTHPCLPPDAFIQVAIAIIILLVFMLCTWFS